MATQPDAAFDDAFAEFTNPKEGDPPAAEPAVETPPVEEPAPAPEPAAEPGDGGEPPAETPPAEEPPAEEPPAEPAPAAPEPPASNPDDILQRLSALVKEAPAAPAAPAAEPAAQEEALYTPDEQAVLKSYEEDWPEVSRAEELKRRAEYRELASVMFAEIGKFIAPINELVTELATRTHLGDLEERVPDYQELRDGVVQWVDTQPAWLQPAYKNVMQQGTADEVADLINRYRAETGKAAPAAEPAKPGSELPPTAKKAAKSMAPVTTKRTAMPLGEDPNDFDAAFAKFAAQNT